MSNDQMNTGSSILRPSNDSQSENIRSSNDNHFESTLSGYQP